jgi:SAM-dependent methyltransferase
MKSRQEREAEFHDKAFSEHTRASADKFYLITKKSKAFYQSYIQSRCQNKDILEYGCGPGNFVFKLAKAGARVTGIDISPVAIDQAKAKAAEMDIADIQFRVMDAENITLPNNSFDLIFGTSILHHLNIETAYSELARLLRKGGTAIFIEPLGHNPLINLYRRLTPQMRTSDEHPLFVSDLDLAKQYFATLEPHYFHLFSLAAVPFRRFKFFPHLLSWMDAMDFKLVRNLPFLCKYAWIVCLILKEPRNLDTDND